MKNKIILIAIAVVVLVVGIKFIPFGTKKAMMGASLVELEVPKFSTIKTECCTYSATFKTLRSTSIIQSELDKIMTNYKQISCDGKTYYYNFDTNVTIKEYGTKQGLLFNTFYIEYSKGNACEEQI